MTEIKIIKKEIGTINTYEVKNNLNKLLNNENYATALSDLIFNYNKYIKEFSVSEILNINFNKLLKYKCIIPIEYNEKEYLLKKTNSIKGGESSNNKKKYIDIYIDKPTTFYRNKKYNNIINNKIFIRKSLLNQRNLDIFNNNYYIIDKKHTKIDSLILNFNKFIYNNKKYLSSNDYIDNVIVGKLGKTIYNIFQKYILSFNDSYTLSDFLYNESNTENNKNDINNNTIIITNLDENKIIKLLTFMNNMLDYFNSGYIKYFYNTILENIIFTNNPLPSKSYEYLYSIYNPYCISKIESIDSNIKFNFVSKELNKIIINQKLNISTKYEGAFLNDIYTLYKKYFNNFILFNNGIDVEKNYTVLKTIEPIIIKTPLIKELVEYSKYTTIFINKYGLSKYKELYKKYLNILYDRDKLNYKVFNIKEILNPKVVKLIELDIKKQEIIQLQKQNYPWIDFFYKLKKEVFIKNKLDIYKKLRKYIPKKHLDNVVSELPPPSNFKLTELDFIKINDIEIICPHIKDKYELLLKNNKMHDINNFLEKYYAYTSPNLNNVCSICGEILSKSKILYNISYSASTSEYTQEFNELKQFLYKKNLQAVYSLIDFKDNNDSIQKQIMYSMTNELYNYIKILKTKIEKDKNYSKEILDYRLSLFISIYIHAYLTRLFIINFPNINLKYLSVNTNTSKINEKNMIKIKEDTVLNIYNTNNFIINKLQNLLSLEITKKYINELYLKALDNLSGVDEKIKKEHTLSSNLLSNYLYKNIIYSILSYSHIIYNIRNKEINYKYYISVVLPKSLNSINVLGGTLQSIYKNINLFKDAKNPFNTSELPSLQNILNKYILNNDNNRYKKIQEYYSIKYKNILPFIIEKVLLYTNEYYSLSPIIFDTTRVTYNNNLINFNKKYSLINDIYEKYKENYLCCFIKPFNNKTYKQVPVVFNDYNDNNLIYLNYLFGYKNINKLYLELVNEQYNIKNKEINNSFHKHSWDYVLYTNKESFLKNRYNFSKYNKKDLCIKSKKEINTNNEFIFLKNICSICYNSKEDLYDDIKKEYKNNFKMMSFVNIVTKICPEKKEVKYNYNTFHEYENGVCKICKFNKDDIHNVNYYNKYKDFINYTTTTKIIKVNEVSAVDTILTKEENIKNINYMNTIKEFIDFYKSKKNIKYDNSYLINSLNDNELLIFIKNIGLFDDNNLVECFNKNEDIEKTKIGVINIKNIILYINSYISKINNNLLSIEYNIKPISVIDIHKQTISILIKKDIRLSEFYKIVIRSDDIKNSYYIILSYLLLFLINTFNILIKNKNDIKISSSIFMDCIEYIYLNSKAKSRLSNKEISRIKTNYLIEDESNLVDNRGETSYDNLISEMESININFDNIDYSGENEIGNDEL